MTDIFDKLESNDKNAVERAKQLLREQFIKVNEPWLLNGLYEYYLSTNSQRAMDILVNIKEPHHVHLFDRLSESMRGSKLEVKVQALTLFGYVARQQPTWLYRLQDHALFRDLLKSLKNEVELLPLISALLVLIVLLPMIPSAMGGHLREIFDIFSRLASWNCNPGKFVEDQLIHLQVALYALFLRLYGMYPCNFLVYLKNQYKDKNTPVFVHTIKPMLDTVKMHPSLITASEDTEVTTERWRSMDVHDVIVECERFSLDLTDRCPHDTCQFTSGFRSRSGTTNSTIESQYHLQNLKSLAQAQLPAVITDTTTPFFTPSKMFEGAGGPPSYSAQGVSPPEAAMEATPETTPVRDYRVMSGNRTQLSLNSNIARALTTFGAGTNRTTPTHSQPSSPMHKELATFGFGADTIKHQKLAKLKMDRSQVLESSSVKSLSANPSSPLRIISQTQRSDSPSDDEDEQQILAVVSKNEEHFLLQDLDPDPSLSVAGASDHGSPCTEGGLHMPNSTSITNFAKRVRRLRHHSTCNPEREGTNYSSSYGRAFEMKPRPRRATSCPQMAPLGSSTEEVCTPRKGRSVSMAATQTENYWPYEHLFLGAFPNLEGGGVEVGKQSVEGGGESVPTSIYDKLDRYIEVAVRCSDINSKENLKEQLDLVHQQLLFERHRRETHAYRNRRLLSDAKSTRSLEEYNSALRDTVQLQQKDLDDLRTQLETYKKERTFEDKKLNKTMQYWENQCKALQDECKSLQENNERYLRDLTDFKSRYLASESKLREVQAELLDAVAEANIAKQQAILGEKGKKELEQVNKELLMIGELHLKYQERLDSLDIDKVYKSELEEVRRSCHEEVKVLNQQLETKLANLEAYRNRVIDLEQTLVMKDDLILSQKQLFSAINEEKFEKLEAVESKYRTQLAINRCLEEKVLDLWQRLDDVGKRMLNSPDTSSCHEVNVTTTAHSSPLSASLASSEGSSVCQERELKNLQAIVDQNETALSHMDDVLKENNG